MQASRMNHFWTPLKQWDLLSKKQSDPPCRESSCSPSWVGSSARCNGNVMGPMRKEFNYQSHIKSQEIIENQNVFFDIYKKKKKNYIY